MAVKIKLRSDHVLPRDLALSMSSSPYFACKRYLNSSPDTYAAAHSQDKIISTLPVPMTWAVANFQHSLPHHTRPIDHHIGHHPGSFTFESQGKSLSSLFFTILSSNRIPILSRSLCEESGLRRLHSLLSDLIFHGILHINSTPCSPG